jgi:hypothetical protein
VNSTPEYGGSTFLLSLLGCGLRRAELTGLTLGHLQQRDGHRAIVNFYGKCRHVRTMPVPNWVKIALDRWVTVASISEGAIFRRVSRTGTIWRPRISEKLVWWIVRQRAEAAGIERLAPHDLHRTCARLCHAGRGELEQSSSCSPISWPKRRNVISARASASPRRSMTRSAWNQILEDHKPDCRQRKFQRPILPALPKTRLLRAYA